MRKLSLVHACFSAIVLSVMVATCSDPKSHSPTNPVVPSASNIEISGPGSVAPGQSAQFTALISLSDGASKEATPATNVVWRSSNTSMLQVGSGSGLATAGQQRGDVTVTAEVPTPTRGVVRRSTKELVILPDGTYRMVGAVRDAELSTAPIPGARVEVTPGPLVATTDSTGQYKLYGVPADAEVRITKDGYQPLQQSVHLTANATQNFTLTSLPRLSLAGNYTLAIDVSNGCSGSPPLTADLQHRRYDAVLTQTGAALDVALTEPRFRIDSTGKGNRFSGQAGTTGATFTLESYFSGYYYYYYLPNYPNVAERLSNGTFLVPYGTVATTGSAAGLSGQLTGGITNWGSAFPTVANFLGGCYSFPSGIQFTLTPR